jgi:hypothetical protein
MSHRYRSTAPFGTFFGSGKKMCAEKCAVLCGLGVPKCAMACWAGSDRGLEGVADADEIINIDIKIY